ncbi:MAG: hypothetical protein ABWY06_21220 [Pseudomonas sp.]|uniref:hypothetical protein n=1 Tax=Pseudomonas sp. TaxID=306 RepID=UPI0033995A71
MNDFLGLLARRVLAPTTLRPRRLSRFEGDTQAPLTAPPHTPPEVSEWVAPRQVESARMPSQSESGANSLAANLPEPAVRAELPRERQVPAAIEPLELSVMAAIPRVTQPSLSQPVPLSGALSATPMAATRETPLGAVAQPEAGPTTATVHSIESVERDRVTRELIEQRVERLVPVATAAASPMAGVLASPPPAPLVVAAAREPASVPVVEISIGRIELFASAPPAQVAPPERAVTRRDAQSLEAYLSERNGRGGRP